MALPSSTKSDLLLVCVTLLAAVSWMFSKEAVLLMPPLLFMCLRFLLAGLILALVGHRQLRRMNRDKYWRSVQVGMVFGTAMSFWIMGLHYGNHVGEGAFITSLGVVLVPVMARLVFKEQPPLSTWLALPVAVCGLALLSLDGGFQAELGQLFFLASAMIFALFFTLNTRAANNATITGSGGRITTRERVPALALTSVVLVTVGLVTGTASLLLEPWRPTFHSGELGLVIAAWVIASATLGTAARFFLQTYAQSLSMHSHGVVIMILEPMWTALLAALWFGETMSATQLGGCAMIFLALLVNRWGAIRRVLKRWIDQRRAARA
ncbi:DMT family transporter [Alloalcanivorax xenomutans]|uniref:DMT family transporter n=1 Tax=Alloalcanivorax xenomutans TaxID=1094342 RepID=UPI0009B67719|nr:DMT family transporter [Alloalcanivorax xenomutans]ARB45988.1 permease [Alloalcanivorax xenomutans]MCE7522024.1 DMT family transporter [Alloalcanivorax xenomutans]PHS60048.1 MAG: EamA/RhaT family transporter [Alcanivorax sp.]WOD26561.1 DMT family transporter [Alloalcanivorax xenomutans]